MVQTHNWLMTSQALYQLRQVAVLFILVYYRRCHCQWLSQYMGIRSARLQPLTCGTINSQNRYCMHTLNILTQPTNKQQWWITCLLTVACPTSWVFLHAGRVKQIEISNVFVLYLPYIVMSWRVMIFLRPNWAYNVMTPTSVRLSAISSQISWTTWRIL